MLSNDNKVSIVISVLNGGKTIEKCLHSIFKLNYPNMEIIIIDGGSTDETIEILKKFDSRISYWKSEKDHGIYDAWNKALKKVTGNWVAFIGADDIWASKESMNILMEHASYPKINFICARARIIDGEKKVKTIGAPFVFKNLWKGMRFIHIGSMHHKSLFKNGQVFDSKYKIAGDYDFFVQNGKSIKAKFISKDIVFIGAHGLSRTMPWRVFKESFNSLRISENFGLGLAILFYVRSFVTFFINKFLIFMRRYE
ncbi:glycosyltransferase [Candidatus Methylopumilus universalis]|uniref:Glycosyltransferase n=1 Tax=Candidatus Methylopumilus universalis TaxID=2588536 RepID=A0AAX1EZR3_9PROT|nr:glycosyltransferase family 2 protein [Candidatus Methylopumilus universalis]QDC41243.1 glycosyltransferase [Candidatus Methylopumilus universalis]QDC42533.1 glycosyltransferase [Candidatus Methylopumilus universalis]QDC54919.1 glycosyltransferase [Candidatus Methylopumilus universalis]QDC56200.1 glycosyltransferase [Candidatus Methylopumilus universalis]QDC57482.1 glycosyltransferase [Candidatus Methylopumilus universalis]